MYNNDSINWCTISETICDPTHIHDRTQSILCSYGPAVKVKYALPEAGGENQNGTRPL